MPKIRHTEAQMIGALQQMEAGRTAAEVAREVGVSAHTLYAWKAKSGGMDVSEAQEAKQLREENARLKKMLLTRYWTKTCESRRAGHKLILIRIQITIRVIRKTFPTKGTLPQ